MDNLKPGNQPRSFGYCKYGHTGGFHRAEVSLLAFVGGGLHLQHLESIKMRVLLIASWETMH
jgi:hypothetical protein